MTTKGAVARQRRRYNRHTGRSARDRAEGRFAGQVHEPPELANTTRWEAAQAAVAKACKGIDGKIARLTTRQCEDTVTTKLLTAKRAEQVRELIRQRRETELTTLAEHGFAVGEPPAIDSPADLLVELDRRIDAAASRRRAYDIDNAEHIEQDAREIYRWAHPLAVNLIAISKHPELFRDLPDDYGNAHVDRLNDLRAWCVHDPYGPYLPAHAIKEVAQKSLEKATREEKLPSIQPGGKHTQRLYSLPIARKQWPHKFDDDKSSRTTAALPSADF